MDSNGNGCRSCSSRHHNTYWVPIGSRRKVEEAETGSEIENQRNAVAEVRRNVSLPFPKSLILSRFRWVECQLQSIARLRSDWDRREALNSLPLGLPKTYMHMFEVIGQVREDKEIAVRIVTWLLYAARPLRLDELAIAVMIKPGRRF